MTVFVDKIYTNRQTSTSYYLLNCVCKYVQLWLKAVNFIQCQYARHSCTVFKILYVWQFFAANYRMLFSLVWHGMILLPDTIYLHASSYQINSSPSDYKLCQMFLCTCVYKISKNTYANIFSGHKSISVHIGFVSLCTVVTTIGNIFNQLPEARKRLCIQDL